MMNKIYIHHDEFVVSFGRIKIYIEEEYHVMDEITRILCARYFMYYFS